MKPYGATAGVLGILLALTSLAAATDRQKESYVVDSTGNMTPRWDDLNRRVLSYQLQTPSTPTAVQITSLNGVDPTVRINVLKDFPGAIEAVIADVASGPDRSVVVACRLKYNNASALKELILTYDSTGKLIKAWDVAPYEPSVISSDEGGNVYSFGTRYDVARGAPAPDYATLVEYSSEGKIVNQALPSSLFPIDTSPTLRLGKAGPPFVEVSGNRIYVYAGTLGEAFVLDRSGDLLRRYSTKSFLRDFASANHYSNYEVIAGAFGASGDLYFDVGLNAPVIKGLAKVARVGVKLDPISWRSSQWPFPREYGGNEITVDRRMMGTASDGSVVSLVRARGNFSVEIASHPAALYTSHLIYRHAR